MARGKKPAGAVADAKKFAEKMGYRWEENSHPDLLYDLLLFKSTSMQLVKVRVMRYPVGPDTRYEDLLPADIAGVRSLPFPKWMPREIWLRTQDERAFRRLQILDNGVFEIGLTTPEGYVNPHARESAIP